MSAPAERIVTIPGRGQHDGLYTLTVKVPWTCLRCGAPRGEPFDTVSYDGSRRLACHGWANPCGHVELYSDVRRALALESET